MPTYEYKCEKCGHLFEKFQGISEEPVKHCPECEGKVKRLISPGAGLIFRGAGFYQTDYRKTCPNKDNGSKNGDASGCSSCACS